jgi:hypothetical protein
VIRSGALFILLICVARPCLAQLPFDVRGYYLNVGLWSDSTPLSVGGLDDIQRVRLMSEPHLGPFDLEIAYEHAISYSERPGSAGGGRLLGVIVPGGGEWLDLQWTVAESDNLVWTHRLDRLSARYSPAADIEIGRQTISWATTLLLTPADPFIPFDPSDPFREFRAGVDAVRAQAFPGALSELELVLRPADTPLGETLTLLGRGRTVLSGWELSAWAGVLHDGAAAAIAAAGALSATAVRTELSLRDDGGDVAFRGTAGLDRRFSLRDRDLYVVLEYQHDGFGATDAGGLPGVLASDPFARGELQVLGRDEVAAEATYQLHPLISVELLNLWNLHDGSALLAPGLSYSLSNEATARAGAFFGLGRDVGRTALAPRSEYGIVPTIGYLSVSLYF